MVDSTHSVSPIHSHMTHSVYSLPQTPNHLFYTTSQPLQHPRNFHSPCQHPPTPSEIYQHYPPTQPHFIPTNQFAPPPPAYEQQRPISLAPDRVHENQMDPRILEMQDSFEAIRARQSSFRAQILEELGQLHLGPKAPVTESASSPLKFGSLPAGSVTLTVANGSSSTLSASSRGIPISEKPNLKLSPHEVTLGLNKNFTTAFVNGNHSEHTTTAVMTEELVLNVNKNIARGFTGVEFSDSYGSDVATSIVWRNDAQHTSFRDGSSAGYGELVSHNHNSVGNIRVDFHEREEKELEDAYGEDDNEDEGENDGTESYVDGESYSDDFQSVDGQIVTDSDEEVVTDDEGSRLYIKKEALLETMYQSKDPKSLDEAEMLENLFNCLCGLLMPLENRDINAGIKEETSRRDVGDSSLDAVSLEPLKLTKFAKQVAEQLFGRADILELIAVCAIFISASVLVGTHDQLFSYYKSSLMKHLRELAHIFDIKGQMEMTNKLCERLLKQKDQHRDIASIAMKAMVAEVSTQSLAQSILGSILPQSIKGSTARGMNTEIKCECPDILCYALHKFGDIMATDHELLLGALLSQLSSNQKNVGKKSVSCIASLASSLSDDLLAKATVRVVQHLSNKGTKYKMTQTSLSQVLDFSTYLDDNLDTLAHDLGDNSLAALHCIDTTVVEMLNTSVVGWLHLILCLLTHGEPAFLCFSLVTCDSLSEQLNYYHKTLGELAGLNDWKRSRGYHVVLSLQHLKIHLFVFTVWPRAIIVAVLAILIFELEVKLQVKRGGVVRTPIPIGLTMTTQPILMTRY